MSDPVKLITNCITNMLHVDLDASRRVAIHLADSLPRYATAAVPKRDPPRAPVPPILPGHFSEDQIAECFGVSVRVICERGRASGIMRKIGRREGSPYWYVRGTVRGHTVYASTKESDKASARRFKDALETKLARLDGEQRLVADFQDAANLYAEANPDMRLQWRRDIERVCAILGNHPLGEIRPYVLIDAANRILPRDDPKRRIATS